MMMKKQLSNYAVALLLMGACTPDEKGGLDEGTDTESGSGDGDGDFGDGDGDGNGDGDGEMGSGQLCDPAPFLSSNACGDGIVGEDETCDDANAVDDDGCSNSCVNARGQIVVNFARMGAGAIAGVPGPTPEQTTIVLGIDPASIEAVDPSGAQLWSTPLSESEFVVRDIQVTQAGEYVVAGTSSIYEWDLWLARLDAQGQVISSKPLDPSRGGPHADTLLRADESLVVVGFREINDGLADSAGTFAYDAALDSNWETTTQWGDYRHPIEPTELSDGSVIVGGDYLQSFEGQEIWSRGLHLTALDPMGEVLWTETELCSVDIGAEIRALAALSDDKILISMHQDGGDELLVYDQDSLVSREQWPLFYASHEQIFADDQGGAWLVGDADTGSYVAYWHPDPARRWIGEPANTGGVIDAWLEPDRRIWYTTGTGQVFGVSI